MISVPTIRRKRKTSAAKGLGKSLASCQQQASNIEDKFSGLPTTF